MKSTQHQQRFSTIVLAVLFMTALITACDKRPEQDQANTNDQAVQNASSDQQSSEKLPSIIVEPEDIEKYWVLDTATKTFSITASMPDTDGIVTVKFTIGTNGKPHDISVIESTPNDAWNEFGLKAVENYQYSPSFKNIERQPVITFVTLNFTAGDKSKNI